MALRMATFHTNEFVCSLPSELKDRTLNVFALRDDGPSEFNIVVSRDELDASETIEAYIARQLHLLSERVAGVTIVAQARTTVDGEPAILVDFTWAAPEGTMHQRQVTVKVPGEGPSRVVVFTGTTREALSERWEQMMNAVLADVRFRR